MHQSGPTPYNGAINPLEPDAETILAGGFLYGQYCASCHGRYGMGDGVDANSLSPSPALLAFMIQMPMTVDEYLLWSVAEGGEAFGSDMPAFKDTLSRDEIWQVVTYMRAGFPDEPPLE